MTNTVRQISEGSAPKSRSSETRPRVVIVGGGFAGMEAARALENAPVDVTVIDRANHHLFQPLLYQVATMLLSPSDVATPIRAALRNQANATVLLAEVTDIAPDRQAVILNHNTEVPYDYLIVASGARHSYFGNPHWESAAPGLKTIDDALDIRRRLVLAFERWELAAPTNAGSAPTIVIIGAGPTGVELAATLPEMTHHAINRDFRHSDPRDARIILIERGPRILAALDAKLSERARADLDALGVEVRTNAVVSHVTEHSVHLGEECIPAAAVFWAAGNEASPLGRQLGAPVDRAGRVLVAADLSIPDQPNVFVVGDLAAVAHGSSFVPAVATAANQMGRCAGNNVRAAVEGRQRATFSYRSRGTMAVVGRGRAVAQIGRLRLGGLPAFLLWAAVHLVYVASYRNRGRVFAAWIYSLSTRDRGDRIIGALSLQNLTPR